MLPMTRWWRTGFLLVLTAGIPHWVREGDLVDGLAMLMSHLIEGIE
jgi:hypothetical protein